MGMAPANHFLAKNSPKIELIFILFMTARACRNSFQVPNPPAEPPGTRIFENYR
jgi:hypothetical protein